MMARCLNFNKYCPFSWFKCPCQTSPFGFLDLLLTLLSLISFLVDIITDIIVIVEYYKSNHFTWVVLTTSLVCVPSLIVQIFSIRWYIQDGSVSNIMWFLHVMQLGVCYRYIHLLQLGFKVWKSKSKSCLMIFNHHQSDICMLRLFESFMESAPQLVLQLYIMFSTDEWNPWTGISASASIFSLGWGISAYSKAMRNIRPEKKPLSWWGLLFQAMWRIGMVSTRIIALVLFATAYGHWLIIAMAFHWFSMTVWVFMQNTDFCSTWWEERLYNCIVGIIYCFCYFNVKEGKSRLRMTFYYFLTSLQNIIFALMFYFSKKEEQNLKILIAAFVPAAMICGITSMLFYYRFFHPSGPIKLLKIKIPAEQVQEVAHDGTGIRETFITLKTCRKGIRNMNLSKKDCSLKDNNLLCENLNISRHSSDYSPEDNNVSCISVNNISCMSDLHRSHSLNCSMRSWNTIQVNSFLSFGHRQKSKANHYRNVNYNFRLAANSGILSEKVHCSCLVLITSSSALLKESVKAQKTSLSASLPNLDITTETTFSSSFGQSEEFSSDSANYFYRGIKNIDFSDSDSDRLPIIYKNHIIRLNV